MCTARRSFSATRALRASSSLSGLFAASALVALGAPALAAGGPEIVTGGISIAAPTAHSTVVTQTQDKGIINWKGGMDVLSGDSLQFAVPTAHSVTLNRISNGLPTKIDGSLSSNGRLVVVNPSGMMVGAGGSVNVSSLIATTADISNGDFLAGNLNFAKASADSQASIVNKGHITAADGGLVALVAPSVRNDGVIQAKLGQVVLGGGQSFRAVDLYGDGLYSFQMTDAVSSGNKVENHGTIQATGGTVLLTANAAKNLVDHAINTDGIIEASSASFDQTGAVVLDGGQGDVAVAGKIDASGKTGGNVQITGANIQLASAIIDASGAVGGGNVAIGGGAHGLGSIAHAQSVTVDAASKIDVGATGKGNGGSAVVWSDQSTKFAGKITGTGGAQGGKGGQAEISSAGTVDLTGSADLHGVNDTNGTLLIDPADITIGAVEAAGYSVTLNNNSNVVVATGSTGAGNGDITVNAPINWGGTGNLTLNSFGNTTLNADVGGLGGGTTIVAGKNVTLNNAQIGSFTGNLSVTGVDVSLLGTSGLFTFGNVAVNNSGVFTSTAANSLNSFNSGTVTLNQSAAGSVQNAINAIGAHGATTITLGTGLFDEHFVIDRGNLSLVGSGTGNTFIRPTSMTGAPVVTVAGNDYQPIIAVQNAGLVNVSNLTIANTGLSDPSSAIGLSVQNGNGFNLSGSIIVAGVGVALQDTPNANVTNNIIVGEDFGLAADSSDNLIVSGNFLQGDTAVFLNNQAVSSILANGITTPKGGTYGVAATNVDRLDVNSNNITADDTAVRVDTATNVNVIGNNTLSGLYGVYATTVQNLLVTANGLTVDASQFPQNNNNGPIFQIPTPPLPTIAVNLDTGSNANVTGNFLSADFGVVAGSIGGLGVTSNQILANTGGVVLFSGTDSSIATNNISAGDIGVQLSGDTRTNVSINLIQNPTTGISANGETDLTLFANNLTNVSDGILATNITNLQASFNAAIGRGDAGSLGFLVGASDNAVLQNNYLQFFDNNILLLASNAASLSGNFAGNGAIGIAVRGSNNATIGAGNTLSTNNQGILITDGSANTSVTSNAFSNNAVGLEANNVVGVTATANGFFGDATGIRFTNVASGALDSNILTAQGTGVTGAALIGSNGVALANNQFNGYATGLSAAQSDNLTLSGDVFTANALGVSLNNSQAARLVNASITTPAGGTGVAITNGSGGTVMRDTTITGGDVGVRVADAGSSMQFEDNGSNFSAMGQYFVLENGAMVGSTLDAGAQIFEGVRASDFTLAQRDAAEGITTDVADNAALGDVFYKNFPGEPAAPTATPPATTPPAGGGTGTSGTGTSGTGSTGTGTTGTGTTGGATGAGTLDLTALNEFQIERNFLFRTGLFSYAGRTIANNVAQTPFTFQVASVNLSLLAPAAGGPAFASAGTGGAGTGGAAQLANLSTASGGAGTGEGSGADQLASLSPAAGAGLNCGNSFLGAGFRPEFEAGDCRVNAAR